MNTIDNNDLMIQQVEEAYKKFDSKENRYSTDAAIASYEEKLKTNLSMMEKLETEFLLASALLNKGNEQQSVDILNSIVNQVNDPYNPKSVILMRTLALAYLRLGERQNCVTNHSSESCILPIRGNGVHKNVLQKFMKKF
jgi:outer membrane PBP1 activator LpoA protein